MSKRKSILSRVITAVIVLLVLALVIGVICKFTRIDDDVIDLFDTTYRVEYNGVSYTGNDNKIALPKGEQARFIVKSVDGYKVTIKPNVTANTDFTYTVDGVTYKYSETNLAKAFLSQDNMQSGYFTLNALDDYSLESTLSKIYEGQTVLVDNTIKYGYLLEITSNEKTIQFQIESPYTVKPIEPNKITLDCTQIVF